MKKLSVLFLSVSILVLSLTSCNSDEDNNDGSIKGKWELSQIGRIRDGKIEHLQELENENGCSNETFEFFKDGAFTKTNSYYFGEKCNSFESRGTWIKIGNKLTVKYEGVDSKQVVEVEISRNELKIKHPPIDGDLTATILNIYVKK
jgi:hypothetical protein